MKINLDDNNLGLDITEMMNVMKGVCEKEERSFLKRIGEIISSAVRKNMTWRSGIKKTEYAHMQDDVQAVVKNDKNGRLYVRVQGGKKTGYKWRFLNDGAITKDGTVLVHATHFIEKSIKDSQSEVDAEADKLIERIVNDGK